MVELAKDLVRRGRCPSVRTRSRCRKACAARGDTSVSLPCQRVPRRPGRATTGPGVPCDIKASPSRTRPKTTRVRRRGFSADGSLPSQRGWAARRSIPEPADQKGRNRTDYGLYLRRRRCVLRDGRCLRCRPDSVAAAWPEATSVGRPPRSNGPPNSRSSPMARPRRGRDPQDPRRDVYACSDRSWAARPRDSSPSLPAGQPRMVLLWASMSASVSS